MIKSSLWLFVPFLVLIITLATNTYFFTNNIIFSHSLNFFLSAIIALVFFPICYGLARKNLDLFEPSVLFMLGVVLGFIIPGYMFINNPEIKGFYLLDYDITSENLNNGLWLTLFAVFSFTIGYYFTRGKIDSARPSSYELNLQRFYIAFYIYLTLYIIGSSLSFFVLGDQTSRGLEYEFGYGIFQPFTGLSNFLIVVWLVYFVFTDEIKNNIFLTIIMVVLLFSSIDISSRGGILGIALAIFATLNYTKFKFNFAHGIMLLMLAMVPIVAIGLGRYDTSDTAFDIYINFFKVAYLATFSGLEPAMIISEQVPNFMNFYNGKLLLGAFLFPFFPRIIFQSKPEVYGYNLFWEDFISASTQGKSEYFVSLPGHFYLDFGLIGIIIGCAIIGILYAKLYKNFRYNINHKGILVLYVLACITVFFQTPFAIPTSMIVLQVFILPIIFFIYVYQRK